MKRGIVLLLFLLVIPAVSAEFFPNTLLGGTFRFPSLNFADLYDSFGLYIDSVIYLLIFLGLGKVVFGGKEKEHPGYRAVYVGLALALTVGILLFQANRGFSVLGLFGAWTSSLLFLLVVGAVGVTVSIFTTNKWMIGGITALSAILFFDDLNSYYGGRHLLSFVSPVLDIGGRPLLYLIAIAAILFAAYKLHRGGVAEGETAEVETPTAAERTTAEGRPRGGWFGRRQPETRPSFREQVRRGVDAEGRPIQDAIFTPGGPIRIPAGIITPQEQARTQDLEIRHKELHQQMQQVVAETSEKIKQVRKEASEEAKRQLADEIKRLQEQINAFPQREEQLKEEMKETYAALMKTLEENYAAAVRSLQELLNKFKLAKDEEKAELEAEIKEKNQIIARITGATRALQRRVVDLGKEKKIEPITSGILAAEWEKQEREAEKVMKPKPQIMPAPEEYISKDLVNYFERFMKERIYLNEEYNQIKQTIRDFKKSAATAANEGNKDSYEFMVGQLADTRNKFLPMINTSLNDEQTLVFQFSALNEKLIEVPQANESLELLKNMIKDLRKNVLYLRQDDLEILEPWKNVFKGEEKEEEVEEIKDKKENMWARWFGKEKKWREEHMQPVEVEEEIKDKKENARILKIDNDLKRIFELLEIISKARNLMKDKRTRNLFIDSLYNPPKSESELLTRLKLLQDNLTELEFEISGYLKKNTQGDYVSAFHSFLDSYIREKFTFISLSKYDYVRQKIKAVLAEVRKVSPATYKLVRQHYTKRGYELSEAMQGVTSWITQNPRLIEEQKRYLLPRIKFLENYPATYEKLLNNHLDEIQVLKYSSKKLLEFMLLKYRAMLPRSN